MGNLILSESRPLWQVISLALLMAAPFVVGALDACSAIRRHDRAGWVALVLHLAMTIVAIVVPIGESVGKYRRPVTVRCSPRGQTDCPMRAAPAQQIFDRTPRREIGSVFLCATGEVDPDARRPPPLDAAPARATLGAAPGFGWAGPLRFIPPTAVR